MSRHPIANYGREFSDLQIETAVLPRGEPQCVLVEPNLSAVIARVESTIEPRLSEEINLRSVLRVEKERQTGIEEIVDLAVDEARRRLLEVVNFQIESAAQTRAKIIIQCRNRQRAIKAIEEIIEVDRPGAASQKTKTERCERLHTFSNLDRAR